MQTILHNPTITRIQHDEKAGLIAQLKTWLNGQEKNRFAWLAIAIAGHGCVFTPITVLFIMMAGNSMIMWPFAIGAMAMCLITNLAAMPVKYTIPVFFLSLLVDLALVVTSVLLVVAGN